MAKNTLTKLRDCLRDLQPEVLWAPEFDAAAGVIKRSLLE
jgi:quinolinate synthase